MIETLTSRKLAVRIVTTLAVLVLVMCICALLGSHRISLTKAFSGRHGIAGRNTDYEILVGVRLPRVCLAALVGAALACCGVVLQAILRNPLADPYILGISSGAGLGVIVAFLLGLSWTFCGVSGISVLAFLGAVTTVWLVWTVGRFAGKSHVMSLLLAGVVVNAFFSALIMFLISVAAAKHLRSTTLWLMGNIAETSWPVLAIASICIIGGIIALFTATQRLNVLTFGEHEARALGVDPAKVRLFAFACSAFITAVAVSLSGLIGFVGLIVPHSVRLTFGPDHRQLLPLSAIIGAGFVVITDTLARTIIAPEQLPVGVITAIAGGPFFLFLLARYTRKVGWLK